MKQFLPRAAYLIILTVIASLFFKNDAIGQTYYLKTANQANANLATSWNTDPTGAGAGTNATVFTGTSSTWVILASQAATFPASTSTTFAGTLQVDGTATIGAASNTSTTVTVNGTVKLSAVSTTNIIVTNATGISTNTFALGASASLQTANANGITAASGSNTSITDGGSRATITLPTTSNYEFNGSTNQATTGLPATINNLTISNSGSGGSNTVTLGAATTISGNLTIGSGVLAGGTFTHIINGNWINNGGSYSAGTGTVTFSGAAQAINGSASTTFNNVIVDAGSVITMSVNNTCSSLTFNASGTATSLTQSGTTTLTVNGNVTINQPTSSSVSASWNINAGTATVSGLISFAGTGSTTTSRVQEVVITTGTLNADGGISFAAVNNTGRRIVMSGGAINLQGALTLGGQQTLTSSSTSIFNYYDDTNSQTISFFSSGSYSNLTINNTSSGGATLGAAVTGTNVTQALSVQSGKLNNGGFAMALASGKNFSVSNGATFNLTVTSAMVTVSGGGTKTFGTSSTVSYTGTTQTVSVEAYGNLTLGGSLTKTFAGLINIAGNLSISGTVASLVAGTISTANSITLAGIGQPLGFYGGTTSGATYILPTWFATSTGKINVATGLCTAGTWTGNTSTDWNTGSNWCSGTVPTAATDVIIQPGTPFAPTIAAAVTANCNAITINAGATLTLANSATALLNVNGDYANNGTLTAGAASKVSFTGSVAQLMGGSSTTAFSNLTINKTAAANTVTSQATAFTVSGDLTVTQGNLVVTAIDASYLVTGNFIVSPNGTFTHSVNWDATGKQLTIGGNIDVTGLFTYTTRSHVQMTGTSKTIRTGTVSGSALSILTLNAATVTANGTLVVNDNFWAMFNTAGSFTTGGQSVTANGGLLNSGGTVNVNGGTLTVASGITVGGGAANNGTLNISAGSVITDGITLGDVTGTTASNITQTGGTLQVNGSVVINQPAAAVTNLWSIGAGTPVVTGNVTIGGTTNATTRIARISITTGSLTIGGNLTLSTNATAGNQATAVIDMTGGNGTLNVAGNLSLVNSLGTLSPGTTSTQNFNGTAAQTFPVGMSAVIYNNLQINNTNAAGATMTNAAISATNVTGNISVGNLNAGSLFNTGNFNITFGASKTLTVAAGSTMNTGTGVVAFGTTGTANINGTYKTANAIGFSGGTTTAINTTTNTPTVTLGAASTVEYSAAGTQVVTIRTYPNLALSGSGNKTFAANTTITNNFSMSGTAIALLANGTNSTALTLTLGGVNQSTGTWGGNTSAATNKSLQWFGTGSNGILGVNTGCTGGTWLGGFSTDWNDAGNWCGGIPTATTDVIIPSAPANQPVIGAAGGLTRNITISSGASLTITTGNLAVSGNWTNSGGTFNPGTGTVTFNSTTATQTIGGTVATQTFNNITVNKSGQALAFAGSTTLIAVGGTLTLTAGTVTTGSNTVSVTNNASGAVVRTSGYIIGNLKRAIAAAANTYDYPVGTVTGYTPASFAFTAVGTGGDISLSSTDGAGSNYPAALHATKKLARYWTAVNSGVTGITGSATFTYLTSPSDLAGGAASGNLRGYVYNASVSYPTSTSTTSSSFTFNGLTTLGEFGAGECKGTIAPTFVKTMASSCGGGADGTITVTAAGGTAPYTYSWTSTPAGFTANTAAITGLASKDYTVVVSDVTTCSSTIPDITIWQAVAPTVTNNGTGSSSCGNTGSIILYAGNGVPPYTYSVDGTTYQGSNTFTNLAAGTYTGYVKDLRGCVGTKTNIVVTSAAAIVVTAYATPASSCGNTGSIQLFRTGGVAPYTYSLDDITYYSGNTFTSLAGNTTYTGWVKDSKGCKSSLTNIAVGKATAITVTAVHTNTSACASDGTITLHGAGGVPPYTYSKVGAAGPYQSNPTFTGLAAGGYVCWIMDSKSCKNMVAVTIGTTASMVVSATATNAGGCNNAGKIQLFRTGGVAPYTYSLDNITYQSSNTFTGLGTGTYTGWVKDASGCAASHGGISITGVSGVSATASHTNSSTCVNDGTIQMRPSGGVAPYTYSLDDITYQSNAYFSNLATGSYTGWVKDANGCKASVGITISYNFIAVTAYASPAANCMASNGSIQLFVSGGVNPYTYSLDGVTFQSSNTFHGLGAGDYDGYVKDSKGCLGTLLNISVGPGGCPRPVVANKAIAKDTDIKLAKVIPGSNELKIQAYPNPTATEFTLKLDGFGNDKLSITVTDIMGRPVYHTDGEAKQQYRFGNNFLPGIYLVQVIQGTQKQTIKLIKQ